MGNHMTWLLMYVKFREVLGYWPGRVGRDLHAVLAYICRPGEWVSSDRLSQPLTSSFFFHTPSRSFPPQFQTGCRRSSRTLGLDSPLSLIPWNLCLLWLNLQHHRPCLRKLVNLANSYSGPHNRISVSVLPIASWCRYANRRYTQAHWSRYSN